MAPCHADVQNSLFRLAFACPDREPSSVCVYGAIAGGKPVTVLTKNWKSPAVPKGHFSNDDKKMITRLQVATPPPKEASMIAVLAAPETLSLLPLEEMKDDALVGRIDRHVKNTKELNLDVDIQRCSPLGEGWGYGPSMVLSPPSPICCAIDLSPTGNRACGPTDFNQKPSRSTSSIRPARAKSPRRADRTRRPRACVRAQPWYGRSQHASAA
jgi:hypothetical protein